MEMRKYHGWTNGRTDRLTGVGARDTCVSKNHSKREGMEEDLKNWEEFVEVCQISQSVTAALFQLIERQGWRMDTIWNGDVDDGDV